MAETETEPDTIVFVAAGPGRSGADSALKTLTAHPSVTTAPLWNVPMIAALNRLLAHAPDDGQNWLPRRAAQALTEVVSRLDAGSDTGKEAARALLASAQARSVTIPVYGRLWMPAPLPRTRWQLLVRKAMLLTAADGTHLAVKIGPHCSPLVTGILSPQDCLLYAVRHPAETVIQLTASQVDGMRPAEAVHFVSTALAHARRVLSSLNASAFVIRLEALVSAPTAVLSQAEQSTRLKPIQWPAHALQHLPTDIRCVPDLTHQAVQGHGETLTALASQWGYA
ncbi:hypothetical protein [Streptomyces arenae]|uniref:hypothetical protein n=1 Tax=Streptomyces arenae TaxID=29301 RepID=UPI00265B1160|nr:hypothetical protein [Streptomyces arenae]MCG7210152.1 hypothetical protein [Streptomyces arenae]